MPEIRIDKDCYFFSAEKEVRFAEDCFGVRGEINLSAS